MMTNDAAYADCKLWFDIRTIPSLSVIRQFHGFLYRRLFGDSVSCEHNCGFLFVCKKNSDKGVKALLFYSPDEGSLESRIKQQSFLKTKNNDKKDRVKLENTQNKGLTVIHTN